MQKRTVTNNLPYKRMLSMPEAMEYCGLGRESTRKWLDEIGATYKIGRRVLFDRVIIDNALNER